jgi:hypothetical protein
MISIEISNMEVANRSRRGRVCQKIVAPSRTNATHRDASQMLHTSVCVAGRSP